MSASATARLAGWIVALIAALMARAARRTLAERDERVARASHELRGGVGAARLGLALVGQRDQPGLARLRAVQLELDRAVLALQELDGQPSAWRFDHVDMRGLLRDSVEACAAEAAVRGAQLQQRWSGEPAVVIGDRIRLAQAVDNLIGNAIEHGGGVVAVSGRCDAGAVRIEVSDDGPGLPAPVADLASRRSEAAPHGHGLRIASEIASGHGGRLSAAPSVGGARLVLELPAIRSSAQGSRAN